MRATLRPQPEIPQHVYTVRSLKGRSENKIAAISGFNRRSFLMLPLIRCSSSCVVIKSLHHVLTIYYRSGISSRLGKGFVSYFFRFLYLLKKTEIFKDFFAAM